MELPLGSNSHGTCQGNFFIWCVAMVSWWHNYPRWVRLAWISYWKAFLLTTWHELMDENIIKQRAKHSLRRLGPISFPRCHDRTPARSWAKKRPRLSLLQNGWRSQVVGKRWVNFARRRRNAKSCGLQKVTKKKLWKLIEIFEIEGKPTSTPTCPHCHIETHMNPMLSTGSFALGSLIEKTSNAHQASAKIKLAHLSHSNLNYQTTQDISLQISMSMVICYLSHAKCWGVRSSLWVKSPLLLMDVPFFLNRAGMGLAPELLGCPNLSA